MKEINLQEYGRKIYEYKDLPHQLDNLNCEIIGWYARYQHEMIPLELQEARFWQEVKDWKAEKPKSDAIVRALWKCTPEGMRMLELDRVLKTLEKLSSTIRSSLRRAETEARNLS